MKTTEKVILSTRARCFSGATGDGKGKMLALERDQSTSVNELILEALGRYLEEWGKGKNR